MSSTPTRSPQVSSCSTAAPERVGRAEHHVLVRRHQDARQLADRGRLAGAVDADDQHDARAPVGAADGQPAIGVGVEQRQQLLTQHATWVGGVAALDAEPGAQVGDDLLGRSDAQIGGEQRVLDRLPGVLVEAVARQQAQQAAAEGTLGAGQPLPQPDQPGTPYPLAARASVCGRGSGSTGCLRGLLGGRLHDIGAGILAQRGWRTTTAREQASDRDHADDGDREDEDEVDPLGHAHIQPSARSGRRAVSAV